jgi:hypothetical protein
VNPHFKASSQAASLPRDVASESNRAPATSNIGNFFISILRTDQQDHLSKPKLLAGDLK